MLKYFLILFAILLPSFSFANCDIEIVDIKQSSPIEYDTFSEQTEISGLNIQVRNNGTTACEAKLVFKKSSGKLNGANDKLPYKILDNNNNLIAQKHNDSNPLIFNIPAGETINSSNANLSVKSQDILKPSLYQKTVTARAFVNNTLVDTKDFNISANISSQLGISFGGTSGQGNSKSIDFGNLEEGEKKSVGIFMRANEKFKMTFSSLNRGKMVNLEPIGGEIDYTAKFGNKPLDLSQNNYEITNYNKTKRKSKKFSIKIGDLSGKPAGRYNDIININIFPNN